MKVTCGSWIVVSIATGEAFLADVNWYELAKHAREAYDEEHGDESDDNGSGDK